MRTSISSGTPSRSTSPKVSPGISSSPAATLHNSSSCQLSLSASGSAPVPVRWRAASATSGKSVCASSCASENLNRPRGRFGLYSIWMPRWSVGRSVDATVLASKRSSFAITGIFIMPANSIGSNGGPIHPASSASITVLRAKRVMATIGSSSPAIARTEGFVHWALVCGTPVIVRYGWIVDTTMPDPGGADEIAPYCVGASSDGSEEEA